MAAESSHKTVIGLTGGIASGKTAATDALRSIGFSIVDADVISRDLTARGSAAEKELITMFKAAAHDGTLDRRALRYLISSDSAAREKLNAYMHPIIVAAVKDKVAAARSPVVLSAPLLFETGLDALCDYTVCVVCPREKRIERIMERDGADIQSATAVVDMQSSDEARIAACDFVISSDCDIEKFSGAVKDLFTEIANGAVR